MCDGAIAFAAAFRRCGIEARTLPPPNQRSFERGMSFCRGSECSPCFATIGEVLTFAETTELAPDQCCIFLPEGPGPCRFGQYTQLLRLALKQAGFPELEIYSPTSEDAYARLGAGSTLQLLAWKGILLSDFLYKCLLAVRPYEKQGEAFQHDLSERSPLSESAYWDGIRRLESTIERGGRREMRELPHLLVEQFMKIPCDRALLKPKVAIVGEIYVRLNEFSNNNLVKMLEEAGAEVAVEPLAPWILYTNWVKKQDALKERKAGLYLAAVLQDWLQRSIEHGYSKIFYPVVRHHETSIEKIMGYSKEYFPFCLRGEAGIAIGAIVDRIRSGYHGIVNILPLNCMPGNNVKGQIPLISQKDPGIPIMNLEIKDGSQGTYIKTRVGPFVESARCAMRAGKA